MYLSHFSQSAHLIPHVPFTICQPRLLSKTEWNTVRRCAEQRIRRDHGLSLALATLFRYVGPRVSEVAAVQIPDVQVSARRGLLVIRRGKGLKHREVPLVQEAREPLDAYFDHREHLAEHWRERATKRREAVAPWSTWPDGHLFKFCWRCCRLCQYCYLTNHLVRYAQKFSGAHLCCS